MTVLPRMLRFVFIGTILPVVLVALYAAAAFGVMVGGACQIGTSCIVAGWEAGPFIARLNILSDMMIYAGIWAGIGIVLLAGIVILSAKSGGRT